MEYESIYTLDYVIDNLFIEPVITTVLSFLVVLFIMWGALSLFNFFRSFIR